MPCRRCPISWFRNGIGPSSRAHGPVEQYVHQGDIIEKGHITVSDRPGIGLTLNEEAMKEDGAARERFFST